MGTTKGIAGALLALLAVGCSSPAEKVVKGYLNQKKCSDRAQFILRPDKNKAALERYYKGDKDCVTKYQGMDASSCKGIAVGAYCTVTLKKGPGPYCLKKENTGFKIDWRCSVGYSETPLKVFMADHPKTPVLMRVWAKLSDYYPDEAPRGQFLSVTLKDDTDAEDHFFMVKSRRVEATDKDLDFPPEAAFHKLLADGEAHKVMVDAAWNESMGDDGEAQLLWVVQDNWKSLTDGELAAIEKKRVKTTDEFTHPNANDGKKLAKCCDAIAKLKSSSNVENVVSHYLAASCYKKDVLVGRGDLSLKSALGYPDPLTALKDRLPPACSKLQ